MTNGTSAILEVERLVGRLEASDDATTTAEARELVRGVLAFHSEGLARIVEIARGAKPRADASEPSVLTTLVSDPVVSALLVLHGLHPHSIEARAREAVARLQANHTTLELVDVCEGVIHLKLAKAGSIASLITKIIETELAEAVPDAVGVTFAEPPKPLIQLRRKETPK